MLYNLSMNAIELEKKIKEGLKVKVFDIRTEDKYKHFHITGATFVKRGDLIKEPEKYMSKDEKVFITCNSGNSASRIAKEFRDKGYNMEHIEDGMNPIVKKYAPTDETKKCCKCDSKCSK